MFFYSCHLLLLLVFFLFFVLLLLLLLQVTFIITFIFLLLTNTFHILLLTFSWCNKSIVLFIHLVILVLFLSFFTFNTFLAFFEKGHIKLKQKNNQKLRLPKIQLLTSFLAFSYTLLKFCVIPSSGPRCFSAKFTAFLYDNMAAG